MSAAHLAVAIAIGNESAPSYGATLYAVSHTVDNEFSILTRVANLYHRTHRSVIWLAGVSAMSGYPGCAHWRDVLVNRGVAEEDITPVTGCDDLSDPMAPKFNTATEADAVVKHAKTCGITNLTIIAWPGHHLRAFITFVTSTLRLYPELNVFVLPGERVRMGDAIVASQGTQVGTRWEIVVAEVAKMLQYKNLASGEAVLAYMEARDRRLGL